MIPLPAYDAAHPFAGRRRQRSRTPASRCWSTTCGATAPAIISRFIAGGKTHVIEYHAERNPIFPEMKRPEPIPPNVDAGLAKAREIGADVVCILDGDADRCGFGDENGEFVDQLRVFAPAGDVPARGPRRARADRQDAQHHVHARQARQALRRAGRQYGRRLQVCRAGDDGARRADRRRGERRLRLPRPRARARRHPGATCTCST